MFGQALAQWRAFSLAVDVDVDQETKEDKGYEIIEQELFDF